MLRAPTDTFPSEEFVADRLSSVPSKKIPNVTGKKPETDSVNAANRQKRCPKTAEMEDGKF